jgi:dienelactone hydrolase
VADAGARARNFSPWYAWMVQLGQIRHVDPFPQGDPQSIDAWKGRCRVRLDELLGPDPVPVPLELEMLEDVAADGYRRQRVVFDSELTMSVPAYLLVPDGRGEPGPAVLAVHGHGPGKDRVCGLDPEARPSDAYGLELVRRGYVVLAPDLRCFGERADWNPPDHYGCDTNLVHATMAGVSPLTQNVWDMARALDVLQGHTLVDPARMGAVGFSYGATVVLFLAARDERVRAAVVSGYFSSWAESHKMPWNMCGSQVLPGMLGRLEHLDVGALMAPRALLVESGRRDDLFPVAVAVEEMDKLRLVYESLGAGQQLAHDVFDGGHEWHGTEAWPLLERWLGPG